MDTDTPLKYATCIFGLQNLRVTKTKNIEDMLDLLEDYNDK